MSHVKQVPVAVAGNERAALIQRWLRVTREQLPSLAAVENWPIFVDHCFMRVCLDTALGSPWTATVARPAIRTMTDAQLAAAVAVAEGILAEPARLPELNARSLAGRRAARLTTKP